MIRTEKRSIPVLSSPTLSVDGLVRVRRFNAGRRSWRVAVEQHEPVGVVVRHSGKTERIEIPKSASPNMFLVLIAMPLAAGIAARLLSHR